MDTYSPLTFKSLFKLKFRDECKYAIGITIFLQRHACMHVSNYFLASLFSYDLLLRKVMICSIYEKVLLSALYT